MITINDKQLLIDNVFSGGELNIKLPELGLQPFTPVVIDYRSKNPEDIFKLALIVNAIRVNYDYFKPEIYLNIPYLPYARQDRACHYGESFALEVVMKFLHSLNISQISVLDIHSNIAKDIAKNNGMSEFNFVDFINTISYIRGIQDILDISNLTVVAPDMGARNRIMRPIPDQIISDYIERDSELFGLLNKTKASIKKYNSIKKLVFEKERTDNGIKQRLILNEDTAFLNGKHALIVDDICDGGATFTGLSKELYNLGAKSVSLFITHGIFRNGTDVLFDAGISNVITTNSLIQTITNHKGNFHVIKI